jgi:hydrogenase nickel incorporation protein HypA/HybF
VHELSVCWDLLHQVAAVACQHGASTVSRIHLRLGPLSGIEAPLLAQAFTIARAGSVAAQAELVTERLPVRVRCTSCGAESEAQPNRLVCGVCGDWRTALLSGDELLLASVELDLETDHV